MEKDFGDYLVPPAEVLAATSDGTPREQYKAYGDGFLHPYLIGRARLRKDERVLEVGSGNGQKARALVTYLDATGSYEGIDIIPAGVEWCQEHYRCFKNFQFKLADIYNDMYNPQGTARDFQYSFPFPDNEFDLVFLASVFTHMLNAGISKYISEIARVLKPGGRCLSSYFLLNPDSLYWMESGRAVINLPHVVGGNRVRNEEMPSDAVGVDEAWVREHFLKAQLRVTEVTYGHWCGGRDLIGALQDVIIAIKMQG
jgi:SAM-dependent methyltransferase